MSHAEALRMFRIAYHNCFRSEVADNSGINRDHLAKLERGFTPITPAVIRKLAGFYNVGCVPFTRLFNELDDYDITKPKDYQKDMVKISNFFINNQL